MGRTELLRIIGNYRKEKKKIVANLVLKTIGNAVRKRTKIIYKEENSLEKGERHTERVDR